MLSICIPIYNYDVRQLVRDLHRQASDAGVDFEILLADDGSQPQYLELNRECATLSNTHLKELQKNGGRSRIRNLLAQWAMHPWLVFMDCDSQCPDNRFIQRYLDNLDDALIVCGGRTYRSVPPQDGTLLHWLFGTQREVKPATIRARKPNHSFMTNNFVISSQLMKEITFNESLIGYGHEDTLFGLELLKKQIHIKHIDNPLIHVGLQNAEEFLSKTREGTRNLLKIYNIVKRDKNLPQMVKLLKTWAFLRKTGLCRPFGNIMKSLEPAIIKNLKCPQPRLIYLDLFKLGCICRQTVRFRKA